MAFKIRSLILLFLSTAIIQKAQAQCSVENEISHLFKIQVHELPDGRKILSDQIREVEDTYCFSKAVNSMPDFFNYLKTNFSDRKWIGSLDLEKDSLKLKADYDAALKKDDKFLGKLEEFTFKTSGILPKDSIYFSEILDVAVKFFSIKGINEDDRYVGKVCVGINDIKSTMPERKPFLEAFAFSAIMYDMKKLNADLMEEFTDNVRELYNLNLGIDKEDRLLRAQGAVFYAMKNNAKLNGILALHYVENQEWLPFVIKDQ